jgi:hypothetical protein
MGKTQEAARKPVSRTTPAAPARRPAAHSNSERQEQLKRQIDEADSGRLGSSYQTAAWSGRRQVGAATLEGNVGSHGAKDALGGAKGKGTARTRAVANTASGRAGANARITVGSADNNARLGVEAGLGLEARSGTSDVDRDGVPERSFNLKIGPFSIGWTTEQLFSVITEQRYHQLRRQAEAEVVERYGRVGDGGAAGTFYHRRLKQLVDAEVAKVRSAGKKKG